MEVEAHDDIDGIIPAHAGNTRPRRLESLATGDHPRVCGEHAEFTPVMGESEGSSPRVRGTPGGHERAEARPGIIPACAGNTALWAIE